jgi:hypothetical protein
MNGIGMKRRLIALVAAWAVALQMFLPFAALAASFGVPGSVICSSATPSDNPSSHEGCSCAAGCGLCSPHMPAVLPCTTTTSILPQIRTYGAQPRVAFQVAAIRFAPQAARPPPLG